MKETSPKESLLEYGSRYLRKVVTGFYSLIQGMDITLKYFINPKTVITQQYPENRDTLEMFDRFRGPLSMPHNQDGENACTACGICEKACPNGTISVLSTKDISGRKVLGKYIYRVSQCTFCGLCVEACPFGALAMSNDFELSVYDRNELTWVLNKPQATSQGEC
ncbi:MAG: 4Fe-4S binding protein [Candidatus Electrothrix sp. GW3-4]|uniref:4Fe-4S binding protein n=1 Tax=Candidatus Electrothrix sp. GW3-4 TaxID=3126740 RepID=UPI0030D60C7D